MEKNEQRMSNDRVIRPVPEHSDWHEADPRERKCKRTRSVLEENSRKIISSYLYTNISHAISTLKLRISPIHESQLLGAIYYFFSQTLP